VFRQEVLEVSKRIINAPIINTQHYFKTYPARCQWPNIGPGANTTCILLLNLVTRLT